MIPEGLTITGLLTSAQQVVTEFDGLILLVGGFGLGFFVINYIISKVKAAKRG